MISKDDLISLGVLKRTHNKDLPAFVFVQRDGLFVPFRSSEIASLMGEEVWVLKSEVETEDDEMAWVDFEGWTVVEGDTTIGTIVRVDDSTMNIFAELEDGRMLPLHEDFIVEMDEDARVLRVQLPFAL
jgi:ribosomal 30S subunit maturation factor RimM